MRIKSEYLLIGGIRQWIHYNGINRHQPLMLFLHGGPGMVLTPLLEKYAQPLYEKFLLVNWDQRGAGKTVAFRKDTHFSLQQIFADCLELIAALRQKFGKEKIILIGHSWGSVLGIKVIQAVPQWIEKYIGIGQIGHWLNGERLSHQFVLEKAREKNKRTWVKKLERMGKPPYARFRHLLFQKRVLLFFGGSIKGKSNYQYFAPAYFFSKTYSFYTLLKIIIGIYYSLWKLWDECLQVDLPSAVNEVDVPIYFISGRHDHQVPASCSQAFYQELKAPKKTWFWFEHSAHYPMFEEPAYFNKIMLEKILR